MLLMRILYACCHYHFHVETTENMVGGLEFFRQISRSRENVHKILPIYTQRYVRTKKVWPCNTSVIVIQRRRDSRGNGCVSRSVVIVSPRDFTLRWRGRLPQHTDTRREESPWRREGCSLSIGGILFRGMKTRAGRRRAHPWQQIPTNSRKSKCCIAI